MRISSKFCNQNTARASLRRPGRDGTPFPAAHRLKTGAAFTLVELLTVITIVGILSSFALISFQERADRELLNRASKLLQSWLDTRRTQAMAAMNATGTGACVITVTAEPSQGVASLSATEANPILQLNGNQTTVSNLCQTADTLDLRNLENKPSQIILTRTPSSLNQVIFTFRGTSSTDAEFKLTKSGHSTATCVKVVKPLGLLRLGRAYPATADCDYRKPYTAFLNS